MIEVSILDTRYHFIKECSMKNEMQLEFAKSRDQIVDIFTKFLKFENFRRSIVGKLNLI